MSGVLTVLLIILKVLGIILLSILAILMILLLLVLFVPVRYKAEGSYKENIPQLKAKVTYLLHIVSVSFDLTAEEKLKIRILGFCINKKKNDEENSENKSDKAEAKETLKDEVKEGVKEEVKEEAKETFTEFTDDSEEIIIFDKNEDAGSSDENEKKEKDKKEKDKKKTNSHKSGFYDKISKYREIIDSKEFLDSFELCKKQIGKIVKAILPKRFRVDGSLGFSDPSMNGKVCAVLGMLYPLIHKNVFVGVDFETEIIDVEGYCKGRLYGITLLLVFLRVFFNRKIRKVLKMFKGE